MRLPDVEVTVRGGVVCVHVSTPGLVVEIRDYDVDGSDDDGVELDQLGERCTCDRIVCDDSSARPSEHTPQ